MPEWMSTREAAEYLRVARSTLYRWCDEGRLRYFQTAPRAARRFRREDLDDVYKPGGLAGEPPTDRATL